MYELVNTPGWLEFIGDRKMRTLDHAKAYVTLIQIDPQISYYVARLKNSLVPVGIVTISKRNYLDHPDIGFALLPGYWKKGYALEASKKLLEHVFADIHLKTMLAITKAQNINSIELLKRLSFVFDAEIEREEKTLHVYSLARE